MAAKLKGVRGLVAEHVKVDEGFEAAIAAALGSLGDAVLAETADAAFDALAHAGSNDMGRVEVVVASASAPVAEALEGTRHPRRNLRWSKPRMGCSASSPTSRSPMTSPPPARRTARSTTTSRS